jgi:hypothetical protein
VRLPSPVAGEKVVSIDLVRCDPLIIRHRPFFTNSGRSEYIFDVKQEQTVRGKKQNPYDLRTHAQDYDYMRFRIYSRDSFSNYGAVFTMEYRLPHGIVDGKYQSHGDLGIVADPKEIHRNVRE